MKLAKLFENWDLKKLSIKTGVLNLEWEPAEADRDAAWDMYIELLTRLRLKIWMMKRVLRPVR